MVSSIGAGDPAAAPEQMRPYLQAKHEADDTLEQGGLDNDRPPRPADGRPGHGTVPPRARARSGTISRADVAAVLAALPGGRQHDRQDLRRRAGVTPLFEEAVAAI